MNTKKDCLIYMRTSTMTNKDGDSVHRQKSSVMKWVKSNGYSVKGEYWDIESGKMDTFERPEFMNMISDSERLGIKVLVFSDQTRLSRDIIVQESTFRLLSSRGYSLISSENPDSFLSDSPTNSLIRQIMGSFSEFDRSSTVHKLKVSRIRKKESNRDKGIVNRNRKGKCEGRKRILEIHPELESLIIKLNKNGLSLRKISSHLKDELGYDVSYISVRSILNDIDWMRKERRRLRRTEEVI
jgi:DNA invertase Pin-like site-specific DNA recombinase